jgi:hypothetical protein
MKTIKKIIETQLVNLNIKPVKVVILPTGIVCEHFKNGNSKCNMRATQIHYENGQGYDIIDVCKDYSLKF